jgi:hypothetical protein
VLLTATTQYVEANGSRLAYHHFGKAGTTPIVLSQHFTDTMDHWDPTVTHGLPMFGDRFPLVTCRSVQPSSLSDLTPRRHPP